MKSVLSVQSLDALSGEKIQGYARIADKKIPVSIINGAYPGRRMLFTAGVHGMEHPGILALIEIMKEINPEKMHGEIIAVHIVNTTGFYRRSEYVVPEDGKNINMLFPGNWQGSLANQLAAFIEELQEMAVDFYLDLHSGDLHENLYPHIYIPCFGNEKVMEKMQAMAEWIGGCRVLSYNKKSAAGCAAQKNIPALLLEHGGLGRCSREDVDAYKIKIKKTIEYMNIYSFDKKDEGLVSGDAYKNFYEVYAPITGLWIASKKVGDYFYKGDILGCFMNPFGDVSKTIYAEREGRILYQKKVLPILERELLIAFASNF